MKLLTVPRNIFPSYLITFNIGSHRRLIIAAVFLRLAEREEEMVVVSKLAGVVVKQLFNMSDLRIAESISFKVS